MLLVIVIPFTHHVLHRVYHSTNDSEDHIFDMLKEKKGFFGLNFHVLDMIGN